MNDITKQIYCLRLKFDNEKIFNATTREELHSEEVECIEDVIKKERIDGDYEIGDDLIVTLDNGNVYIKDYYNE